VEHSLTKQRVCSPTVTDIISQLHEIKNYVGAAGVLIAVLFDRNLGPSEDDLPLRFKIILAAPVVVAVYYADTLTLGRREGELPFIFGVLIASILIYMSIWSLFGYRKTTATPRPWWKPWGAPYKYKNSRVMGGALRPNAKQVITHEAISVQEYFEGTEYNQDRVWTRSSRTALQVILVFSYISVALFYTLTIATTLV